MSDLMQKSKGYENKKFLRTLLVLALPIMLQELINSSVNLLDFLMIGKLGLESINGVGLSNKLFFLFSLLVFGVNSGSAIFMGQFWGKGDVKSIHKVMGICFACGFAVATIFATVAIIFPEKFLHILSSNGEVIRLGSVYLRIVGFTYFFSAITSSVNASLRSIRQTMIPMFTSLVALIGNFIFNYIFIFVCGWGVAGAALGTLAARLLEIVAQFVIVYKLHLPIATHVKNYFTANKKFVKDFLTITVPVILNEAIWAIGIFMYDVAYQFCGNEAQGAMQIGGSIQNIFGVIGMGVGAGCGIMLSNLLGSGDKELAIKYSRKCLLTAFLISAFMGGMLLLVSPLILNFYEVSDEVKRLSQNILYVISVGMIFKTLTYTCIVGILRSGGDTLFCLACDAGAVWLIGVPMAFLGAYYFHLPIYTVLAMVYIEEFVKFIISYIRIRGNKWASKIV